MCSCRWACAQHSRGCGCFIVVIGPSDCLICKSSALWRLQDVPIKEIPTPLSLMSVPSILVITHNKTPDINQSSSAGYQSILRSWDHPDRISDFSLFRALKPCRRYVNISQRHDHVPFDRFTDVSDESKPRKTESTTRPTIQNSHSPEKIHQRVAGVPFRHTASGAEALCGFPRKAPGWPS